MSQAPTILGPSGLPFVDLSGDRSWRQYTKGDIVVSFQWIDLQKTYPEYDEEGPVPCMVLSHAHRRVNSSAYVIPQTKAFAYIGSDGRPTMKFHSAVALAALEMGFDKNDKAAMTRTLDCVYEYLPELFKMSAQQPDALEVKKATQGIQLSVKVNGDTIHQQEI